MSLFDLSHFQQARIDAISKSFSQEVATDLLEKGKASQPIGTIKEMGGRNYIKTIQGWKYHGKGTGSKAQEHAAGAKKEDVVDAAAKYDHSNKTFESSPEGHEHKVGDAVKVERSITDPIGKQGETGTVVSKNSKEGIVHVRFADGNLGKYDHNTLQREKKVKEKKNWHDFHATNNFHLTKLKDQLKGIDPKSEEAQNIIEGFASKYQGDPDDINKLLTKLSR